MKKEIFIDNNYVGTQTLLNMRLAKNYNYFISNQITKTFKKYCGDKVKSKVIDFGAGIGQFSNVLSEFNVDLMAIEIDKNLRKNLVSKNIKTIEMSSIERNSVDYIFSINVLEHIKDDSRAIKDLHAKLKYKGIILIYVPAMEILWTNMDNEVEHYRRYDKKDISTKLNQAGFEIKLNEYADSAGFFSILLFKLLRKKISFPSPRLLIMFDRFIFPIGRKLDFFLKNTLGKNLLIIAQKK